MLTRIFEAKMLTNIPTPRNNREWSAVLGLDNEQFSKLCLRFNEVYKELNGHTCADMLVLNPNGENARFKNLDDLIFAVLLMLKSGITFDLLGYLFQIDQPNAHRKFREGLNIIHTTLEIDGYTPHREFHEIEYFHRQFKRGETLILDGTEQRIQRPSGYDIQKEFYSGKKKGHTIKLLIISTLDKYIRFVSYCWVGRSHDFAVLKEEFPPEEPWFEPFQIRVDLGYQGFEKEYPNVKVFIPAKKPKGGELSIEQKNNNKILARERIKFEHAIGGMKRYDILSNTCRLHDWEVYNQILGTTSGLWNFFITN